MGGKKGSAEIEVNEYLMSMHVGVATSVDSLTSIFVGEKQAWSGEAKTQSVITISKPELFGGEKKEGGVTGNVHFLPGLPTQVLPDGIAQKFGRASGADCPGFRGLTTLFFTGAGNTVMGLAGAPYALNPTSFTNTGFRWVTNNPYLKDIWIGVKRAPKGLNPANAMIPRLGGNGLVQFSAGQTVVLKWWQSTYNQGALPDDEARMGIAYYNDAGDIIDEIHWATMMAPDPMVWTQRTLTTTLPNNCYSIRIYMEMQRKTGSYNDGYIDDITLTVGGEPFAITNGDGEVHNDYGWVTEIGKLGIRFTNPTPHSGTGYFTGSGNDLTRVYQSFTQASSGEDANPAHIIYECLTNRDWGMGAASTIIDVTSFEDAGVTLLLERLGLSMIWTRQTTIEAFISEVLDHIQAVLFVNPRTGLLTLKLIRADYNVSELRQINPDNADMTKFQRRGWGEITNEVVVTWTNPENEQEETVTIQDNAAIAAQGGIVSDSRNYYGVRSSALAMQLAARDLRTASTLLATCEVELDRSSWDILPGEVLKVYWPERGLYDVPMRVGPVDYGKPGDPKITASLMEDIFSFATTDYSEPPSSNWQDDDVVPTAMLNSKIITVPSFFASNYLPVTGNGIADIQYPEVVCGVLATSTNAISFDIYGDVVAVDGTVSQQSLTTANVAGFGNLIAPLNVEATSTFVGFKNLKGKVVPGQSVFMFIGASSLLHDEDMEVALITAETDNTFTIKRGVLDTVPRKWDANTGCYFLQLASKISDFKVRSESEVVTYKLLSRTVGSILDVDVAPSLTGTLNARPHLPLRPANVKVEGQMVGPIDISALTNISVTWSNRNRTLENSQVVYWDEDTVTPETGQTTKITVLNSSGAVATTYSGLTGTNYSIPVSAIPSFATIRVTSMRDGLESLQGFEIVVNSGTGYGVQYGYNYGGGGDPTPGSGGSGGGGGTGTYPTSVSWTSFNAITSTTYAALTTTQTVSVASGKMLTATASLAYTNYTSTKRQLRIKCQVSVAGENSWSDIGESVAGSYAYLDTVEFTVEPGSLTFSQSLLGLAANDYDVRFVAISSAGGTSIAATGTASVTIS